MLDATRRTQVLSLLLLTGGGALALPARAQPPDVLINEILASTTGVDVEYIELFGAPGESLDGLTLIGVEGDNASGAIDFRFDFAPGDTLGGNGFPRNTPMAGTFDEPPPLAVLTLISAVQGAGASSPLLDELVMIEGIVVGDFQAGGAGSDGSVNGFYVQEEDADADANPATSEGIFVFDGFNPATDVATGDKVRVSGSVTEFFGETQVSASTVEIVASGRLLPAAANVLLPTANVVPNADGRPIGDLEAYEGMRVRFADALTVGEYFNLDRFGEIRLSQGGRLNQFTQVNAPDAAGFVAHLDDVASRTIMLDDGFTVQNPDPIRYPAPGLSTANAMRGGDQVFNLTGVLRFSRGSGSSGDETYRLLPTIEPVFVPMNPRPAVPPPVGGRIRIASFNVLNYFNTLDVAGNLCGPPASGLDCRGANSELELDRQTEKLVTAIFALDADVLGLIEIENDYVDGAESSIATLVDAINARYGKEAYAYVDPGVDYLGTDAIAVGIFYKPSRVSPKLNSSPAFLDDAGLDALGLAEAAPLFDGEATSRVPLAASFVDNATGGGFTVVVNHFKSKGQSDLTDVSDVNYDQLDGQGFWNLRRTDSARALSAWLATDPTGSGDPDVVILGDLNAYAREDPIATLLADGYVDPFDRHAASADRYTFLFDGQLGTLDYALISPTLDDQVAGAAIWAINADEVDGLDYSLDFGRPPEIFDASVPYRASDHDPVLIGLDAFAPGDFDGDGRLSILFDLRAQLEALGAQRGVARYDASLDLDLDGRIDARDVLIWIALFHESRRGHGR